MPTALVQATIWPTSNLQADASTNTWTINYGDLAGLEDACENLVIFYGGLSGLYPDTVRQTNHTLKCYNRADAPPRVPIYERVFGFSSAPSGSPLPPEVAMCLSFQGDTVSGLPQARRRGRVYIGPLDENTLGVDGRPTAGAIDALASSGENFLAASDASTTWVWAVWSTVNDDLVFITNGWVDNEYDTQRRRGRRATSRQVYP